jgi:hypothetical protein
LGAGPFQRGTIYEGTAFAGKTLGHDEKDEHGEPRRLPAVELAEESVFTTPQQLAAKQAAPQQNTEQAVVPAVHQAPVSAAGAASPANPAPAAQAAVTASEAPASDSSTASGDGKKPADVPRSLLTGGAANALPQPRFNSPQ